MIIQYSIEFLVLAVSSVLLVNFLRKFRTVKQIYTLVILPLLLFVIGFSMRLSNEKDFIDLGFFFTDFSFLFVYLMFAISFLLGQIKYWKIDRKN